MGRDPMSVVDPEVRGVEGLRVADASIMPLIMSCNLNCPILMIGEKAADLITGRPPLPPSDLPYFVARSGRRGSDRLPRNRVAGIRTNTVAAHTSRDRRAWVR